MPEKILDEEIQIPIPCPDCGEKTVKTLAWLKKARIFRCPVCGEANSARTKKLQAIIQKFAQIDIALAFAALSKKKK